MSSSLLSVQGLRMDFGGIVAVDDVSFDVQAGSVHALIGPNGAGKTTVLNCISRFYTPQAGRILWHPQGEAQDLLRQPSHRIARLGIARTFQNLELFGDLSVFDNVLIARSVAMQATLAEALQRERSHEILESLGLSAYAQARVRDLPYGTQKMVELARALALEPRLMLLDEPAAGMNHREIEALGRTLKQVQDQTRATLLLIEHSMPLVMSISDTITVMHNGRFLAQGTPDEIERHPAVVEAYLGGGRRGRPH